MHVLCWQKLVKRTLAHDSIIESVFFAESAFFVPHCKPSSVSIPQLHQYFFFWKRNPLPDLAFSRYGLQILHRGRSVQKQTIEPHIKTCYLNQRPASPAQSGFSGLHGLSAGKVFIFQFKPCSAPLGIRRCNVAACPSGFRQTAISLLVYSIGFGFGFGLLSIQINCGKCKQQKR